MEPGAVRTQRRVDEQAGFQRDGATASPRRQERKGREMARIRGEIIIERPVEVAFDSVADQPTNRRPTRRC